MPEAYTCATEVGSFFLILFFVPESTTTCKRNRSDSDWENPPVQLFALFLVLSVLHLTSSLHPAWISGSVAVCVLLPTLGPLASLSSCSYSLPVCEQRPFRASEVTASSLFGVPGMLNILSFCSCSGDILRHQV